MSAGENDFLLAPEKTGNCGDGIKPEEPAKTGFATALKFATSAMVVAFTLTPDAAAAK